MNWDDVFKIIMVAVGSVGGIGAVIVLLVQYTSNIIADRLAKKYEANLQKEIEQYKSTLENKNHISKNRYDMEFEIFRLLTKNFFELIVILNTIFSPDYRNLLPLDREGMEALYEHFGRAAHKAQAAQDCLYENGAFIPKEIYKEYEAILELATATFWSYKEGFLDNSSETVLSVEWLDKKHQDIVKIENMFLAANDTLRAYLQSLTIIE